MPYFAPAERRQGALPEQPQLTLGERQAKEAEDRHGQILIITSKIGRCLSVDICTYPTRALLDVNSANRMIFFEQFIKVSVFQPDLT